MILGSWDHEIMRSDFFLFLILDFMESWDDEMMRWWDDEMMRSWDHEIMRSTPVNLRPSVPETGGGLVDGLFLLDPPSALGFVSASPLCSSAAASVKLGLTLGLASPRLASATSPPSAGFPSPLRPSPSLRRSSLLRPLFFFRLMVSKAPSPLAPSSPELFPSLPSS